MLLLVLLLLFAVVSSFTISFFQILKQLQGVPWERGITTGSTNYYDCCSEIGRDDDLYDDYDNDYEVPGRSVGFVSSGCEETCEADYDNNSEFPKRSFGYVPHDYKGQERLFGFVSSKEILAREEMYEVPERSSGFTPSAASQSRKSPLKLGCCLFWLLLLLLLFIIFKNNNNMVLLFLLMLLLLLLSLLLLLLKVVCRLTILLYVLLIIVFK
ncbi:unnamed protein product [Polarella glacialis]|uniref:Transmembrane protein n=1 Tax=Polarella glacialis TaxID=89957 RepID=A0A813HL01_POLGL|nr:unnamed protein product [Polarella glacialis]CAE8638699.1 unnamed protein product [Polarella glacialis]